MDQLRSLIESCTSDSDTTYRKIPNRSTNITRAENKRALKEEQERSREIADNSRRVARVARDQKVETPQESRENTAELGSCKDCAGQYVPAQSQDQPGLFRPESR